MKLSIEELPNPGNHKWPCIFCGDPPRYFAVLPVESPTKGAFVLCNDCANDEWVLKSLRARAERFNGLTVDVDTFMEVDPDIDADADGDLWATDWEDSTGPSQARPDQTDDEQK